MSNAAQAAWDHATADPERVAIRGAGDPWTYEIARLFQVMEALPAAAGATR